ncbi:Asp23/Gls24 family envelope stress response protein, partial [Microbacterium testaceum]|uniref:Asp23/Gls24 family envelope stress response protein n=1 Tax=Microbacterium testaceum TaxID=2033 RepID=UPI000734DA23
MTSIDTPTLDAAAELAATAAGAVDGVHALGSLLGRASDAVRERVGLASTVPGVKIDTDRADSVTATISLVVDYPHKLHEVSAEVRRAVRSALEPLGRGRIDVDVVVTGVFGPFDRDIVVEAEERADAAADRAREVAGAVKERANAASAAVREKADEVSTAVRERADAASTAVREQADAASAVIREKADAAARALGNAKDAAADLAAGTASAASEFARGNTEAARREQAKADIAAADRVTDGLEPTDEGSALGGPSADGSPAGGSAVDALAADGSAVDALAVDGSVVDALAVDGSAVDALAVDGSAVDAPPADAPPADA